LAWLIIPVLLQAQAGDTAGTRQATGAGSGALAVWDTQQQSSEPLSGAALGAKNGWSKIAPQQTAASFAGDAVLSNGRITAVVRRRGSAVEVYSEGDQGPVFRLRLVLETPVGEPTKELDALQLIENTRSAAGLRVSWKTAPGEPVAGQFRIQRGQVFVQTEPGAGAGRLRTECPGRFVILPDFFADDILVDARRMPLSGMEIPSDNFVLHLAGKGDAIGMCVFENRQQDVRVALAGEGKDRVITGSEIGFEGKKIWVAVLQAAGIWHHREVEADDAGEVLPLDWTMPFPAQWRVDFTRSDSLTDSWEMLLQEKKNARYVKPSWLGGREETLNLNRWRWNTYLDTFSYPCWSDHERQGYLQPIKKELVQFQGPAVLYPVNRVKDTALDAFTVVDLMRNTLGNGPCEHVLDVEGQRTDYKGRPTCGVQGLLEEIYSAHLQKKKRPEVEKHLEDGLAFVTHIRSRITRYIEFGHKMRAYLAEQKKEHPELANPLTELDRIVERIDTHVAPETAKIPKPDYVVRLTEDFRKNVLDYDGPDALERCKQYGKALTDIGGNQDELVGESRWVARTLRQRAAVLVAQEARLAPIAAEIRARTQEVLRNPAGYEWSRH
jgi:hypothetical protein